jgi:hypothetical protein
VKNREQTNPNTPVHPVQPAGSTATQQPKPGCIADLSGLYAAGQVISRKRLSFPQKDNTLRYNIILSLGTGSSVLKVERWADTANPADVPPIGQHVCLPVTPVIYNTKSGTNFRLTWGGIERGEDF